MNLRFSTTQQESELWRNFKSRFHCPLPARESLIDKSSESGSARRGIEKVEEKESESSEVDMIVVDNQKNPEEWHAKNHNAGSEAGQATTQFSDTNSIRNVHLAYEHAGMFKSLWNVLRYRILPSINFFLNPAFENDEEAYQNELWFSSKHLAIFGSLFLVTVWLLSFALPRPWSLWNKIQIYALGPVFNLPLLPAVLYDFPRKRPKLWQIMLVLSAYMWAIGAVIDMRLCAYYTPEPHCANRDFQNTLYFACGLPTVALFALQQSRLVTGLGALCWMTITAVFLLPVRLPYLRNIANVLIFTAFIIFTHFQREMADRRLWTLRAELKVQFRAKNRAQVSERKSNDSKRRFTNYIYHEIRGPVNTALLAVQNIEAEKIENSGKDLTLEHIALKSSLELMSGVLNDVLDHSRMERGGFSSLERPFSLKNVMDSIVSPLEIQATSKELELIYTGDDIEDTGIVLGDEMRLRQVINNLASNACKFTEPGGTVSIKATVVYKSSPSSAIPPSPARSSARNSFSRSSNSAAHPEVIVVRIAISDTGVGIRPKDLEDARLFSAYVQTEVGHRQGGKGTGLGLSLVRQIVALSGGRLGVKSKIGEGSTFWVEFALPIYNPPASASASSSDDSEFKFQPLKHRDMDNVPTLSIIDSISTTTSTGSTSISTISIIPPTPDTTERTEFISSEDSTAPITSVTNLSPPLPTSISTIPKNLPLKLPRIKPTLSFGPLGPLSILVVDDDLLTRKLMSRMLERLQCIVETAENGAVALEMLGTTPKFDLVFLDNQMPVLNGKETSQEIRKLKVFENLLICGVTANASREDQESYLAAGANFVLTKPVLESSLLNMLQISIERRSSS